MNLVLMIGLALIIGGIVIIAGIAPLVSASYGLGFLGYGFLIMIGTGVLLAILGILLKRKPGEGFWNMKHNRDKK